MKRIECSNDNCIETLSSCTIWNGGDIEYLGLCNGTSINNVIWEIITKLEDIAGNDLSAFDIDSLLDICNDRAPLEINLLSILNLFKSNVVCLKEYIDILTERIGELSTRSNVNVNLKCYADFDNLGNSLQITREQLDQLFINVLCEYKDRIIVLEGKVIDLQLQIDVISNDTTVDELSFPTCIDPGIKPTSTQLITTSKALCDLQDAVGTPSEVAIALGQTPLTFDADFAAVDPANWIPAINRNSWSDNYNNLLIAFGNVVARLKQIENTCCKLSCDDIELGFSVKYTEDLDGLIITFTSASGTYIPAGFTDGGSTGYIQDSEGGQEFFNVDIIDLYTNGGELEVSLATLSSINDLTVHMDAKITNGLLNCNKCLEKIVKRPACQYCILTATDIVSVTYKVCVTTKDV